MLFCTVIDHREIVQLAPLLDSLKRVKKPTPLLVLFTDHKPSSSTATKLKKAYKDIQWDFLDRQSPFLPPYLFSPPTERFLLALPDLQAKLSKLKASRVCIVPPGFYFSEPSLVFRDQNDPAFIDAVINEAGKTEYAITLNNLIDRETAESVSNTTLEILRDGLDLSENIYKLLVKLNQQRKIFGYSEDWLFKTQVEEKAFVIPPERFAAWSSLTELGKIANVLADKDRNLDSLDPMRSCLQEALLWDIHVDADQFPQQVLKDTFAAPPPLISWFYRKENELQRDYGPLMTHDQQKRILKWGINQCADIPELGTKAAKIFEFSTSASQMRMEMKSPRSLAPAKNTPWGQGITFVLDSSVLKVNKSTLTELNEKASHWPLQIVELKELLSVKKLPPLLSHIIFASTSEQLDQLANKFKTQLSKSYYLTVAEIRFDDYSTLHKHMNWIDEFWVKPQTFKSTEREKVLSQVFSLPHTKTSFQNVTQILLKRLNCFNQWRRV